MNHPGFKIEDKGFELIIKPVDLSHGDYEVSFGGNTYPVKFTRPAGHKDFPLCHYAHE